MRSAADGLLVHLVMLIGRFCTYPTFDAKLFVTSAEYGVDALGWSINLWLYM